MATMGHYHRPTRTAFAGTGVTDGSGNVTINFPAGRFAVAPVVAVGIGPSANVNLIDARITALSATSVTVQVQQSIAVTLLGIQILAAKTAASGVTVQVNAAEAG